MYENSFEYWRELAIRDAEEATRVWLERLDIFSPDVRKAVFAHLPSRSALMRGFAAAMTKKERPLAGAPVVLKDLYDIINQPTGAGSRFLAEMRRPPRTSSAAYMELMAKGAVYAGKTQLNEFAYGLTGRNDHFGHCPHPFVEEALTGGSSSGSAFAVAAGLSPLGLGTDTAGSIRVPAAFCNLFGYRREPDKWIQEGVFPLAPSFDSAGWLNANLADMQTCCHSFLGEASSKSRNLLYVEPQGPDYDEQLLGAYRKLADTIGCQRKEKRDQEYGETLDNCAQAYSILTSREAAKVHERWLDTLKDRYSPTVWQRIERGRNWNQSEIRHSALQRVRTISYFNDLFSDWDAIVMPVTHQPTPTADGLNEDFRKVLLGLNTPISLAVLPALTLPVKLSNGRSGALQVIFPSQEEANPQEVLERCESFYGTLVS